MLGFNSLFEMPAEAASAGDLRRVAGRFNSLFEMRSVLTALYAAGDGLRFQFSI